MLAERRSLLERVNHKCVLICLTPKEGQTHVKTNCFECRSLRTVRGANPGAGQREYFSPGG